MHLTAARLDRINASTTIGIRQLAARLKAEGRDIVRVSSGEPDFDTPDHIKRAAIAAIEAGRTKYTDVSGTPAVREAVAAKFRRDNGLDYEPKEIILGTGVKQILFNALLASINDGDEAIIPAPCWVSYPDLVKLAGGVPVIITCGPDGDYKLIADQLADAITPRTRWLILNNPSNPTGALYSAAELERLAAVLLRHPDIWVLTDDIYEKLVFDGRAFATMAQVEPRLRDRTLTVNGCSKSYAMTGWRMGFGGGPRPLIAAMDKLQSQSTSNPSSISQEATVAALTGPQDCVAAMRDAFQRRRDLVIGLLNDIPGLRCAAPPATFYAFADISAFLGSTTTDTDFVAALLAEEGVAVVPGSAFLGPGHFRLSFAADDATLEAACRRIRRFCDGLTPPPTSATTTPPE